MSDFFLKFTDFIYIRGPHDVSTLEFDPAELEPVVTEWRLVEESMTAPLKVAHALEELGGEESRTAPPKNRARI